MNLIQFVISIWVPLVCAVVIVAVLPLVAGYIVLMERKVMADMQARLGPMRVGPHGLLQPIADAVKLLLKEDIIPDEADKAIFWFAPLISVTAAMLAMSALAIGPWFQIADLNVGLACLSWGSARWGFSESCWADGPPTATTRCSARCAARRNW